MPLVFAAIAPHGGLAIEEACTPEERGLAATTQAGMEELGKRFAAARPDAVVVATPHNVHIPGAMGFSPRPNPKLIATYPMKGEAICVSRGLERDRVVDETGGQTVVFGRRGARPFHLDEMERFFRRSTFVDEKDDLRREEELYRVEDVTLSGGVLATKSGALLTPLATPTPSPLPASSTAATPEAKPSTIPATTPPR